MLCFIQLKRKQLATCLTKFRQILQRCFEARLGCRRLIALYHWIDSTFYIFGHFWSNQGSWVNLVNRCVVLDTGCVYARWLENRVRHWSISLVFLISSLSGYLDEVRRIWEALPVFSGYILDLLLQISKLLFKINPIQILLGLLLQFSLVVSFSFAIYIFFNFLILIICLYFFFIDRIVFIVFVYLLIEQRCLSTKMSPFKSIPIIKLSIIRWAFFYCWSSATASTSS